MERLSTGNARLDEVLGGGLDPGRHHAGGGCARHGQDDPGRTVPVRQRHAGATGAVPVDGVRTLRQAVALRTGARVLRHRTSSIGPSSTTISATPCTKTVCAAVLERLDALIKEHQPGVVVIDSFKALRTFAADEAEFRRFLHELAGRLTVLAVSSLWVGEYGPDEATDVTRVRRRRRLSSRSRRGGPPNDRCATSASASFAAATSCPVTTCTASPPADSSCSRDSPTCATTPTPTRPTVTGSRPASRPSTTPSRRATGPVPPPSSPDHPVPARPSWVCTSCSPARPTTNRGSS